MQSKDDRSVYNLDATISEVKERFAAIDISKQCANSGASFSAETVTLDFLNETYRIDTPTAEVTLADNSRTLSLREKILILHYFMQAKGTPLTGKLVTYRDLPGGLVYYPTFIKRTIKPISERFGNNPELLRETGKILNPRKGETGDVSLIIDAFTKVPINLILWQGDEEFPPDVNLLFDANINDYLPSEDVTIVCETITWRLINHSRKV